MTYIRRALLALVLIAGFSPAIAQVPAAVPALPDTERRTSYSITASTCACAVNFALYGDSTDYQNWVEVFINGVRYNYNDASHGWTITSPSGSLSSLPRPITNAVLTFNAAQTGTVQIVGARRPRRTSQFNENAGVPTRNFNQVLTDIISQNREIWDKTNDVTGRALLSQPGNTVGLLPLPSVCGGKLLGFDITGLNPLCLTGYGTGNRTALTGPTTFYVRSAGSDVNCTGLANVDDPGSGASPRACAFATPQKPISALLSTIDLGGNTATIDLTGSFTTGISCAGTFLGGGAATILGSGSVVIKSSAGASITTTSANAISASEGCNLTITGANITLSTVTSGVSLIAYSGGKITFGGLTFGPAGTGHIQAGWVFSPSGSTAGAGTIFASGPYTITGGGLYHFHSASEGAFISLAQGVPVTITGTPAFSAFFAGATKGFIYLSTSTFSGAATGPRYLIHNGATLYGAASRTSLPGNAAGTVASGGNYIISDSDADLGIAYLLGGVAAPSTPPSGYVYGWFDSTDLRFHDKNGAGTIGTTVVADTGASNQFLTAISAAGVISKAQPSLSGLSDTQFSSTQGSVLYRNASAWVALAPGSNGQLLASGGAAANPSWITASGTGTVTSVICGTGLSGGTITTSGTCAVNLSALTNSLGADVAMNNISNYFDGPSVAQGTSGTWWASGSASLKDTAGAANMVCKLWDGTTVIASGAAFTGATSGSAVIALSGYLASPAGNIRISCKDPTSTSGVIQFNNTGNSKDATISVHRIQ